jgi:hypothetical protein
MNVSRTGRGLLARPDVAKDDVDWLMRPLIESDAGALVDCQAKYSDGSLIGIRGKASEYPELLIELDRRATGATELRCGINPLRDDGSLASIKWLGIEVINTKANHWRMPTLKDQTRVEVCTDDIRLTLAAEGWQAPAVITAGGRTGLLYRVDLHGDDAELVHDALRALRRRHDTERASIGWFGPEDYKILVPGSMVQRGHCTLTRPYQIAGIRRMGDLDIVPRHQIERLAARCGSRKAVAHVNA